MLIRNLTRTYSCLIADTCKFSFAFPLLLLDMGRARKNALTSISISLITRDRGKVDWEQKVFVEKEGRTLTSN